MITSIRVFCVQTNPIKLSRVLSTSAVQKKEQLAANKDIVADEKDNYPHYQKRTIYGEEYPIWHQPLTEKPDEFTSRYSVFWLQNIDFTKLRPRDPSISWYKRLQKWFAGEIERMEISDQRYNMQRYRALGADLAAAHFVCYRNGAVKTNHSDTWIKREKGKRGFEVMLPGHYTPGIHVVAIDFESFNGIRYEGLENLRDLHYLYWISFKNCAKFDDWFLDQLCHLVGDTVEYLDIRGTKATYRGLTALYRFKQLKFLLVDFDQNKDREMVEHTFALLQEYHKGLLIKRDPEKASPEK